MSIKIVNASSCPSIFFERVNASKILKLAFTLSGHHSLISSIIFKPFVKMCWRYFFCYNKSYKPNKPNKPNKKGEGYGY